MCVVRRDGRRIVSDEFLNNGRTDARILHQAGRGVTEAMEAEFILLPLG